MTTSPKILRNKEILSVEDHLRIEQHLCAIKGHSGEIMDILSGRIRVKYLDRMIRFYNSLGPFGQLRSLLEDDLYLQHPTDAPQRSIYYGLNPKKQKPCILNDQWDSQRGS